MMGACHYSPEASWKGLLLAKSGTTGPLKQLRRRKPRAPWARLGEFSRAQTIILQPSQRRLFQARISPSKGPEVAFKDYQGGLCGWNKGTEVRGVPKTPWGLQNPPEDFGFDSGRLRALGGV